jgi:putative addiction module component (TIGR02574 family)
MPLTVTDPELNDLTVEERLALIERLWDSIPDDAGTLAMPAWHREELDRRLSTADEQPEGGIPWEQVKARLRSRP